MAALARLNSDCTSAASGLSLGSKSDNNGSKMGVSGDRFDDVSKPRTGCWADMIAPFAEKMPGKRMPNSGKIGITLSIWRILRAKRPTCRRC